MGEGDAVTATPMTTPHPLFASPISHPTLTFPADGAVARSTAPGAGPGSGAGVIAGPAAGYGAGNHRSAVSSGHDESLLDGDDSATLPWQAASVTAPPSRVLGSSRSVSRSHRRERINTLPCPGAPLLRACWYGDVVLLQMQLHSPSTPLTGTDSLGRTACHFAVDSGNLSVLELLCHAGGEEVVWAPDVHGVTPLHMAVRRGNDEMVQFLLGSANVDCTARDSSGATPLDDARAAGHMDIAGMLEEHIAALAKRGPAADDTGYRPGYDYGAGGYGGGYYDGYGYDASGYDYSQYGGDGHGYYGGDQDWVGYDAPYGHYPPQQPQRAPSGYSYGYASAPTSPYIDTSGVAAAPARAYPNTALPMPNPSGSGAPAAAAPAGRDGGGGAAGSDGGGGGASTAPPRGDPFFSVPPPPEAAAPRSDAARRGVPSAEASPSSGLFTGLTLGSPVHTPTQLFSPTQLAQTAFAAKQRLPPVKK